MSKSTINKIIFFLVVQVVLAAQCFAQQPQSWTVSLTSGATDPSITGVTFPTRDAALSAVRNLGGKYRYIGVVENETITETSQSFVYGATPRPVEIGPWGNYFMVMSPEEPPQDSEEAMLSVASSLMERPECPWSAEFTPLFDWKTANNGGSVSGDSSADYRNYSVKVRAVYSSSPLVCAFSTATVSGLRSRSVACPTDLMWLASEKTCGYHNLATLTLSRPAVCPADGGGLRGENMQGNPCNVSSGEKIQHETDLTLPWITFSRTYRSMAAPLGGGLGGEWTHSLNIRKAGGLINGQGSAIPFSGYYATGGYQYYNKPFQSSPIIYGNDRTMYFSSTGRLTRIVYYDGTELNLTYDGYARLVRATHSSGRYLDFIYAADASEIYSQLIAVVADSGERVDYGYDTEGRLISATYADSSLRAYHYENTNFPHHLTGVSDESGTRYANFSYDANGRGAATEHAGGVEHTALTYNQDGSTTVTTALGNTKVINFTTDSGYRRITSVADDSGMRTSTYTSTSQSDFSRLPSLYTDALGNKTQLSYSDGYVNGSLVSKVITKIEGVGTASARTSRYVRDRFTERPLERSEPGSLVRYAYNAALLNTATCQIEIGNIAANAYTCGSAATAPAGVRQTTYAYDTAGRVLTTNGPRTDTPDVTTYTYYPSDDATCASSPTTCPHRKGDLQTVTNAAGQVTQYLRYDGAGRLLESVDPNGVHTTLTYHPRGWLTSRTVGGLTTSITYDAVGQVIKTTQPDGSFVAYTYDAAHRLTGIADNLGNRIDYTLDAAGNRTAEATKDAAGVLKRSLTRVYDQLGRLSQSIDALGAITQQTYDANGNADLGTDALGRSTDQDVDPLNRLKKSLRDVGGVAANTAYAYDAQDNLTEVTDPNGLKTHYTYNGLNDLTQLSSPDTGTTTYTYDAAGNRLSQTDARGVATSYSYDALNRLTDIAYPDAALNVHFSYDVAASACAAGEQAAVGRLSGFTDASGNTALCYDPLGRLTRKQQTTAGIALTTAYAYAANGRLSQMTTPGGMIVSYGYDSAGRISGIDTQLPGEPSASAVIDAVRYLPFGPIDRLTFGNGRIQTRSYDANYAIDQVSSTGANGLSLDFAVDAVGNLTQVTSGAAGNLLAYDGVDRLTEVKQLNNDLIEAFAYDATGNRTAHTDSAGITPYSYTAGSHRLSAVGTTTRSLDASGNTTAIGGTAFSYDDRNRLRTATVAGQSTQYQYNARGERVSKAGTANTIFVYDEAGHLLGEYASDGSLRAEYVWLGDLPVAVRNADDTLAYMEPDHLGTPRAVIDPVRDVAIWQWPLLGNAFGDAAPVTDPDGDGVAFAMNLRFPGQYFDAETGLHYNYFRDYDPVTGRYVESDPIGLGGGISTFGYSYLNPLRFGDPSGAIVGVDDLAIGVIVVGGLVVCHYSGACPAAGKALQGIYQNAISKPRGVTGKQERYYDLYCRGNDDPCSALKAAVRQALLDASGKMNRMLHDTKLYVHARSVANFAVTKTHTTWDGHARDLEGKLSSIAEMISLGVALDCDMSDEIIMLSALYVPAMPL